MAQTLYINPDPTTKDRATLLGCGWMASVPSQYVGKATAPCVILSGAGQTVVISDNPPTTVAAVSSALAPILSAEQAAAAAAAQIVANAVTLDVNAIAALTGNQTFLAIASPTTAQVATQVKALTRQVDALIRLVANQLDSTAGT